MGLFSLGEETLEHIPEYWWVLTWMLMSKVVDQLSG